MRHLVQNSIRQALADTRPWRQLIGRQLDRSRSLATVAALIVIGGCTVFGDDDPPLPMFTAAGEPVVIHQLVAAKVQSCWFGRDNEDFEGKSYDVVADRDKQIARIRLLEGDFEDLADGDADPILIIDFRQREDLTQIDFPEVPEDDAFAARLKTDVIRWANGSDGC